MSPHPYTLAVDWSRNGTYGEILENVNPYVTADTPITVEWGRGEPRVGQDTVAGRLTFELTNVDRQFSPENTASPIAGKQLPGTPTQLLIDVGTTSSVLVNLFEGPISALDVDPNVAGKTFTAECGDGWSSPGSQLLSTPVYRGERTGTLIGVVLDAIGWPAAKRSIDPGATAIPFWWAEDVDASTAINDLAHSEGDPALWWVESGVFYFRDRHHRILDAPSLTSQGTYTHLIPAGGGAGGDFRILKGSFGYDHGLAHIVNIATVAVTPRLPAAPTYVWRTEDPIWMAANEVRQFIVQGDQPFINAQVPARYVLSSPDGQVISGEYSVDVGSIASITLSRTSGASCVMTVTAGGSGASLWNGMALTANPLTERSAVQVTAQEAGSIGTFGRQNWTGAAPWAGAGDARAIVDKVISTYATPRPSVTFSIAGLDAAHLAQIGARTLSDRVHVDNDELGLDADFMVERVRHTISHLNPLMHQMELGCQIPDSAQPANVFTFDLAGSGFNQGAFAVNGVDNPGTMFLFDQSGQGFNQGLFAN